MKRHVKNFQQFLESYLSDISKNLYTGYFYIEEGSSERITEEEIKNKFHKELERNNCTGITITDIEFIDIEHPAVPNESQKIKVKIIVYPESLNFRKYPYISEDDILTCLTAELMENEIFTLYNLEEGI